jgi:hypothetical protein
MADQRGERLNVRMGPKIADQGGPVRKRPGFLVLNTDEQA